MPRKSRIPAALLKEHQDSRNCRSYGAFAHAQAPDEVYALLQSRAGGLHDKEIHTRQRRYGLNLIQKSGQMHPLLTLLLRFKNPLVVMLLIIAGFSLFLGDRTSALLVVSMAVVSVVISFTQEERAGREAQKLSDMVRATTSVYRNGQLKDILIRSLVPGDVVELVAGDVIPADMRIVTAKDLFVNESSLTGESFPIEKFSDSMQTQTCALSAMKNIVFMGASVVTGSGRAVVLTTGPRTQFGAIAAELLQVAETSDFERGIAKLTWLMIQFMLALVLVIFAVNVLHRSNWVAAMLFSLAVAVGLTPEMLPMVIALNLSKGAIAMSKKRVIVKHLNAMQDFGSMDILCTDKTGTLTLNKVVLEQYCDVAGKHDESVLEQAYINSYYQTGLKDLLDRTILEHEKRAHHLYKKIDEIPFDFDRKIMSVVVEMERKHVLIAKGAPEEIFKRCTSFVHNGVVQPVHSEKLRFLREEYDALSAQGFRVLAVAYRELPLAERTYSGADESDLTLKGYLAFLDPPKSSALETIKSLQALGIEVKILTGDHPLVTKKICNDVGLNIEGMLSGDDMERMSDHQLAEAVKHVTVFSRLSPMQKEKIIHTLRASGHTVGYMGDGINDAPSLKAADVGISVNNAADIAKESADIILLKKSLVVLRDGVVTGRKTFANILKYIRMGTSSNLGNMLSMTGASFLLPFLPMLPIQILLNNFLYDLSQFAIPTDEVDDDAVRAPHRWNMRSIRRFMLVFGGLSSFFDFLMFAMLLFLFHATASEFQTAWFIESLCTQTLVIHIIRTAKIPFLESRSSGLVLASSVLLTVIGCLLPFSFLAAHLGFVALGASYFIGITCVLVAYLGAVEITKRSFVRTFGYA